MSAFSILLASPRGFCAGVVRAIVTVRLCLQEHGAPAFVLHEIVHNRHVLSELESLGAAFVGSLAEIPPRGLCIFSAHGVPKSTEMQAKKLGLHTIDATCPLVASVHRMVEKYHREGYDIIIIGHRHHPEVEGAAGRVDDRVHVVSNEEEAENVAVQNPGKVACVTQTTLSHEEISGIRGILRRRFPELHGQESNICFATQNRQDAVRLLARQCDCIYVVGSKNSSNSNRLREVAKNSGISAYLIDDYRDIDLTQIAGTRNVGVTAGASAPERLVEEVVRFLQAHGGGEARGMDGVEEKVCFQPARLHD
ncbi:MAG: 4-hydroxy-3-methylbut-2-enyl diphosphate reductase [Desulfobulbaceae bacterium]|jgi:4-hydroxy-3-methylbut-2-enyl diphosphate reductase|nr:4-hydroxy-3-methylbut-2-enyl diphosphate reductase [Desulfobulbaceae bacterium]